MRQASEMQSGQLSSGRFWRNTYGFAKLEGIANYFFEAFFAFAFFFIAMIEHPLAC